MSVVTANDTATTLPSPPSWMSGIMRWNSGLLPACIFASAVNPRMMSRRLLAACSSLASALTVACMPPLTWPLAENHVMDGIRSDTSLGSRTSDRNASNRPISS